MFSHIYIYIYIYIYRVTTVSLDTDHFTGIVCFLFHKFPILLPQRPSNGRLDGRTKEKRRQNR